MEPASPLQRKSFGLKEAVRPALQADYHSALIDRIRANGARLKKGRVTVRLAKEFGFCYGVDRAIDYAYEARAKFPGKRIFLTNEIIHNPQVNSKLKERGVRFLSGPYADGTGIGSITREDIVIIPAFGTTTGALAKLQKIGCVLVDTTCGSVMSVWKRVESYSRDGFTSLIHGKYDHEETRATCSRALLHPGGKYIVVRDMAQAEKVCAYIRGEGDRKAFLAEFAGAVSEGFDPDRDLERIGCANQTTMLSSESMEIADRVAFAFTKRYGKEDLAARFRHFDTICSATQDRQDAVLALACDGVALMLVVGGYNSSNTGHLVEISLKHCPAYHVQDAACLLSAQAIRHKNVHDVRIIETRDWLPPGEITVGVTAGASTPNRVVEEVIERIWQVAGAQGET
ncbi:MAG: 4-hydroxy-3-methylbut-2-enyl diphosphate reductase [Candidatus Omnitrophota bacterium]